MAMLRLSSTGRKAIAKKGEAQPSASSSNSPGRTTLNIKRPMVGTSTKQASAAKVAMTNDRIVYLTNLHPNLRNGRTERRSTSVYGELCTA